jgi:hypothetical protein
MELLANLGRVESRFSPFGDSANLDARLMHGLRQTYHRLGNHFGHIRWKSYVTWVMWNLISVRLKTVFVPVQDRCLVCAKSTIGSEIIWMHLMVVLVDKAHVEPHFSPLGDSANLDAR